MARFFGAAGARERGGAVGRPRSVDGRPRLRAPGDFVGTRCLTAAATLGGLVGLGIGLFEVLDSGATSGVGLAVVALGGALVVGGLVAGSHGTRSR